jgi:hypothetical protein
MMRFARRLENARQFKKDYTRRMLRSQRFSLSGVTDCPRGNRSRP